jgi:uncharacterized heparinase superfamily protein
VFFVVNPSDLGVTRLILSKIARLAWTVRYLKARQIRGQVVHRIRRRLPQSLLDSAAIEDYPGCAWPNDVRLLAPGAAVPNAELMRAGVFRFLNREEVIGFPPRWDCAELPLLWQYNLHYFERLWRLEFDDARTAVLDWIENHRLKCGAVGWEPYPTSLRLVNWCGVFFGRFRRQVETDASLRTRLWQSIVQQTEHLARNVETHLLGNHYLENGAALAFVGGCFQGPRATRWREQGRSILAEQLSEQVLADGVHFERSPMYHCRAVYVLAMLLATRADLFRDLVVPPLSRLRDALSLLCHPDGRIALLNDSAFGIYNEPAELQEFCDGLPDLPLALGSTGLASVGVVDRDLHNTGTASATLSQSIGTNQSSRSTLASESKGCFELPDAGFYGWRDDRGHYVLCDFGQIGPDYIPGHAHADIFHFELSLGGQRICVDTGLHDYEATKTRRYCRSTAAHNTVEIDGRDQCEMWGVFRVARRGRPESVSWHPTTDGFTLSGVYRGCPGMLHRPKHERRITWRTEKGLTVRDRVDSHRSVNAVSRVHLHPDCDVLLTAPDHAEIVYPSGRAILRTLTNTELWLETGPYFPEFGVQQTRPILVLAASGRQVELGYELRAT